MPWLRPGWHQRSKGCHHRHASWPVGKYDETVTLIPPDETVKRIPPTVLSLAPAVVLGVCAGLIMRELAALADPNRTGQYWILEVVNWAALWCAVGFVSGFLAKHRHEPGLGGLVAETLMVLGFYLPLGHVQRFHVLWLEAAIVSGPVMGWLGSLARQDRLQPIREPDPDEVDAACRSAQRRLRLEVNPVVLSRREWESERSGFVRQARRAPRVSLTKEAS